MALPWKPIALNSEKGKFSSSLKLISLKLIKWNRAEEFKGNIPTSSIKYVDNVELGSSLSLSNIIKIFGIINAIIIKTDRMLKKPDKHEEYDGYPW